MEAERELRPGLSIRDLRPPEANEPGRAVAQLDMLHSLAATLNRLGDVGQIGEAITAELRAVIDYHAAVAIENARLLDAEREATAKYRALVELSPDAIMVHAEGKLVFVNTAAARLLGARGAGELIGREALSIVHPDYRHLVAE